MSYILRSFSGGCSFVWERRRGAFFIGIHIEKKVSENGREKISKRQGRQNRRSYSPEGREGEPLRRQGWHAHLTGIEAGNAVTLS
jgi:hypothetical protein